MRKEIYINESMEETRIAIQEESQLVEVYIERQDSHRMVGNVYKGKVENVLPGMQAAFVDIGYELNSFLPFSEINTEEYLQGHKKNKNSKNDNIEVDLGAVHPTRSFHFLVQTISVFLKKYGISTKGED